jgi:cyclophilin family peptidyl-prolyl cis-trans isomerase
MLHLALLLLLMGGPAATAALPPAEEARAQLLAMADQRWFDETALRTLAGHGDARVREQVARVVGGLAAPAAVGILEELAGDPLPPVRVAVAEGAGRLAAELGGASKTGGKAARLLRRLLRDPVPAVRCAAAWGIGAGGFEKGQRWLVGLLAAERDPAVRAAALAELWRGREAGWVAVAAAALADRRAEVRRSAAWSLSRAQVAGREAALRRAAASDDAAVRTLALEGCRRLASPALLGVGAAALADPSATVRVAALGALAAILEQHPDAVLPEGAAATVTQLVAMTDPQRVHERVAAITLAGYARLATAELWSCLESGEAWAGEEALVALARQGATELGGVVEEWLAAQEVARRTAAVRALALLPGGEEALGAVADSAPAVRLAVVDALAARPGQRATALLRARLGDSDEMVRAAALSALAQRRALPERGELFALLERERGVEPRVAILEALPAGTLRDQERSLLLRLLGGEEPVVARAAWAALLRHGYLRPLPPVATGWEVGRYREVLQWAATPHYLEVVTVRGTMAVALEGACAPLAAYRLAELAGQGFFDGLTLHRVVPNFVVQGGDPRGDGWGGPPFTLRHELCLAPFEAGVVGLAHAGPDTAGSQFFVTLTPQPHLTGRYPVVGRVVAGFEVAQRLRRGDRILRVRVSEVVPTVFPVWYGVLKPERLEAEIPGWAEEERSYTPRADILALLQQAHLRYGLVVAMGTWCGDSREQIPRLLHLLAELGEASPFAAPLLVGADRTKSYPAALFPFGAVERVPTIVVTLEGAEVGRIVETPASGSLEEDLATILAPLEGWQVPSANPTTH